MLLRLQSRSFTLLLGFMAALPTAGIDIVLPSLPVTGSALDTPVARMGLVMSAYLVGLGVAGPVWGPISDRIGRRPVIVAGCLVLATASLGCLLARSFGLLLLFRLMQGIGACGPAGACLAMVRDLYEGEAARARMASVVMAINVMPMVAPSFGALLLTSMGWRAIYGVPLAGAVALLAAMPLVAESRRPAVALRLSVMEVVGSYRDILRCPTSRGYVVCNAAMAGAIFAYITGSPLFFMDAAGLGAGTYGVIFGVSSLSVILGAAISQQAGHRGTPPDRSIVQGLALASVLSAMLLLCTLAGWTPIALVAFVIAGVALSFGMISPNALDGALRLHPDNAGAAGAVAMGAQMVGAALASDLVARFFDRHSALSMAATMLAFCLAAVAAFLGALRRAERPQARPAPNPMAQLEKRS
ncbi:MAG: Bcr/CflA family efflux MFS transporter [Janthinobacterium lividum]